jgi:hypothetical protein
MIGGHGHVIPRADGARARCGGPNLCRVCALELARVRANPSLLTDGNKRNLSDEGKSTNVEVED